MKTLHWNLFGQLCLVLLLLVVIANAAEVSAQQRDPVVCLQTTKGQIFIRIFAGMVPTTASSFLDLVNRGFYNGLNFHRVENWVIQGGDPNGNGTGVYVDPQNGQPRYLSLETNRYLHHNAPGVVAMAHGPSVNSNSCQFYITKKAMPALDGSYSIFGGVVQGMDVVFNIHPGDQILSARIVSNGQPPSPRPQTVPSPNQSPAGESGF